MCETPLITIVTVTYNAAATVGVTVKSVCDQVFDDYEHLIIDGASKDDTVDIAERYGSNRLRVISEPDKGLYDAMNKGLKNARGKYIVFLNAGDAFHSDFSLEHYGHAAESGRYDIIYADTALVDARRQYVGPRHLQAPRRLTRSSFSHGMLVCHQAFMVRKEIAPIYDTTYRFSADFDWTIKCISNTVPERCLNLDAVEIDYLSEGLTTSNHRTSLSERFSVMRKHYGLVTTLWRHFTFVGRAVRRKVSRCKKHL